MQSTADDDVAASYPNSASYLTLLAPGEFVTTSSSSGGMGTSSGTSMATPHVTGSIASIREAIPGVTADEIDNALGLTGLPVLESRNGITTPRIQLEDAIVPLESAQPDPGDPADPPPLKEASIEGSSEDVESIKRPEFESP
ncbi:MAG: S8/S53 family peptidase [Proteobacteria bacterium]|nr:S8/S53 family peptidase [Pseudomonadota bacterium]